MKPISIVRAAAGVFLLAGLIGCSGGGGGGGSTTPSPPPPAPSPTPTGSSNWDEMVWNQDVWG